MTMKKLPIGYSDFETVISEDFTYVDKSLLINDVINDGAQVLLLPRPRRFGKTLNLSMLRYFFERFEGQPGHAHLFKGLAIERHAEFESHCARYPVIFLTFKDVKDATFAEAFRSMQRLLADEFNRHRDLLASDALNEQEKAQFQAVISLQADPVFYRTALKDLSEFLFRAYRRKCVILIDEYDTPIHTGFFEGYYDEVVAFFRVFLGGGLKDNACLFKGVLTGILRVARESIFSGLNNLAVYSLLNHHFSTHFGLTEADVQELLTTYHIGDDMPQVRTWYNGYVFGTTTIYNPWSIVNYVHNHEDGYRPYWANTSSNAILKNLIMRSPERVRTEFHDLLQDIPVTKSLDENIVFSDLTTHADVVYSFLVFSGYLKAIKHEESAEEPCYYLRIPNTEVKQIFRQVILRWINESYENQKLQQLLRALTELRIDEFEEILNDFVLSTLSYYDTRATSEREKGDVERVYQAFMLGLLLNLAPAYEVHSNKESGFGRYDISIIPKDTNKRAIIMELKKIGLRETKDTALENALRQIEEKRYDTEIRTRGISAIAKLAVTFDGKRVWVREGSL